MRPAEQISPLVVAPVSAVRRQGLTVSPADGGTHQVGFGSIRTRLPMARTKIKAARDRGWPVSLASRFCHARRAYKWPLPRAISQIGRDSIVPASLRIRR